MPFILSPSERRQRRDERAAAPGMTLRAEDREFRATATPMLYAHSAPRHGWIWYAKIPGVLSHGCGQEGPFYETKQDALDAARVIYPNGVIA
jgi:hypothetical protein